jgi:long-chain acyl-CoA synthetase
VVLPSDFTEASGHLTPKLTIKRHVIVKDYASVIEGIYNAAPATEGQSLVH